jgi:hypothetical protein
MVGLAGHSWIHAQILKNTEAAPREAIDNVMTKADYRNGKRI